MSPLKDLFMGALSVVRKRETELDNSFMIFSVRKILVAIPFIARELYERLAANGAEEVEELGRVTKLLQEGNTRYFRTVLKSQQCRPKLFQSAKARASSVLLELLTAV